MQKKNDLIEFYRFLFAMNVVKNHGYFPYQGNYFGPGRISVEFFFVLSGWFLVKSVDKYMHLPYWKGLFLFIKNKLWMLGIPLVIGLIFNIFYECAYGVAFWDMNIWGYLWYVYDMFIVFIFYYTIRKFIKSQKWFLVITAIVFVAASIIHAFPQFYSWGYFRAFSAMSLGVLVSFLPSIKLKKQWLLWIPLACVQLLILRMLLFDFSFIEEELLNLVLYPALIYLTFQLPIQNKVFGYLGALSFGLYAYQSVPRFIWALDYYNPWIFFAIIVVLAVLTDLIKRIIKKEKMMASTKNFVEFVCEQIRGPYDIKYKKMFGEYMVYLNNLPILLVCDDTVYVKKYEELKDLMQNASCGYPYVGAKEHYILDIENNELVEQVLPICIDARMKK